MYDKFRTLLKETTGKELTTRIFVSYNKERMYFQIQYNKFLIEKTYDNTRYGKQQMSQFSKKFKKGKDVLTYFGISVEDKK